MLKIFSVLLLLAIAAGLAAQEILAVSDATIIVSKKIKSPVRETLMRVLQEEVTRRTAQPWPVTEKWPETPAVIAIALAGEAKLAGQPIPSPVRADSPEFNPEGFRIQTQRRGLQNIVWIIGANARATLFGAGFLLRKASFRLHQVHVPGLDLATAPAQPIRGHQLGYRNTANSYDAWNVAQYEQYIRELVVFGTNAIENIPFGNDEGSALMPIPRAEMNIRLSEICAAYDIDYWVWTPATFDLRDLVKRAEMLDTHAKFYQACPRLDHIFFPGGDPGSNHPRDVLPFLKDLHDRLIKFHPRAGIWISLQGFSAEQIDYFYTYLDQHQPDWLRGVVSGPSSPPIAETRFRLPAKYGHRQYPDITHNVRCEFPVRNWDQAYALTIGREGINPRPNAFAKIHATYAPFTDGFVTYSDGCHDDINKIVWSQRGWTPETSVQEIVTDYSRFFFGPDVADAAANGIFALEQNWVGPIVENGGIETTLTFWQTLEQQHPQLAQNWRWQMLLLRANYDAFQRRRKIYEGDLERQANHILAQTASLGVATALDSALARVNRGDTHPVATDLREKIMALSEQLFHGIGLQSSMTYHASGAQRGCFLDFVSYPLNNRWWLADEFEKIKAMPDPAAQLARIEMIRTWENPGNGSYYDNISSIETGPRVRTTSYDACDVAWWDEGLSRARLSAQLYQTDPVLEYENLDFNGRYRLRICGQGEALVRVDGERLEPILYQKARGEFKEFVVPPHLIRDGKIRVTFDLPEESHLNWRDFSHVSDVWLLKQ